MTRRLWGTWELEIAHVGSMSKDEMGFMLAVTRSCIGLLVWRWTVNVSDRSKDV